MKSGLRMILVVAAGAAVAACSQGAKDADATKTAPPVATVDGEAVDRDLYEFYARGVANKPASELTPEQRDQVLDNLVRARVIARQAEKDGITKDPEVIALIELSRLNLLQQRVSENYLKDRKATDQELRAEYETQVGLLPRLEYHARHILVATEHFASKVVDQIEKGAKFEDVARRESMDARESGGDLGWFTPDRMVKPFAEALVALKPGEFTRAPVQTQFGWHIIKLEGTRDLAPPAYDEVRQRIEQMVQSKKFKGYVDELMKTAKVEKKLEGAAPAAPAAAAPAPAASGEAAPAVPAASESKP